MNNQGLNKEAMAADKARVEQASNIVSNWQNPYSKSTSKAVLEHACNYLNRNHE